MRKPYEVNLVLKNVYADEEYNIVDRTNNVVKNNEIFV